MNSFADDAPSCPYPETSSASRRCELDDNVEILRNIPTFAGVPHHRLKLYAYIAKRQRFRPGEFLFRQGEPASSAFILVSGRVQIIREFPDHSVVLNELGENDFFGALALLSNITRLFSVRAKGEVECLSFERSSFQKLLIQFPELMLKVMDVMIRRVVEMEEKLLGSSVHECIYTGEMS